MQIAALKDEGVCRLVGFSFSLFLVPTEGLEGVLLIDGGCIERGGGRGAGKEERERVVGGGGTPSPLIQ